MSISDLIAQILQQRQQTNSQQANSQQTIAPRQPIQLPQLQGASGFLSAGPGIRNTMMSQVLGPLMQQNYGLPVVSPFGGGQSASPGLGQPPPGLRIPTPGVDLGMPRAFMR